MGMDGLKFIVLASTTWHVTIANNRRNCYCRNCYVMYILCLSLCFSTCVFETCGLCSCFDFVSTGSTRICIIILEQKKKKKRKSESGKFVIVISLEIIKDFFNFFRVYSAS